MFRPKVWEYTSVWGTPGANELGEQGWEAFSADKGYYYLKRKRRPNE